MIEMQTPSQIEERAAKADVAILALCLLASVSRATWYRWRDRGEIPQSSARAYFRLARALDDAEKREAAQ